MEDLDALLADLQSTTSQMNSTPSYKSIGANDSYYGYATSGSPRLQPRSVSRSPVSTRRVVVERYQTTNKPKQAIYQTQDFRMSRPSHNTNSLELDSLLNDLNAARYPSRKEIYRPKQSLLEHTSSVEDLLEDLQNAVPGSKKPVKHSPIVSRRTVAYTASAPRRNVPQVSNRELDDLVFSLCDYKSGSSLPPSNITETSTHTQPPATRELKIADSDKLNSMVESLQSNMSADKTCPSCLNAVSGKAVTALGKTWHPEHFTCYHCKNELANRTFFEKEGKVYCEADYHKLYAPKCAKCNGPILDKCVTALDKSWHPEHFACAKCGGKFGEDGFHEKEGKAYCKQDYLDLFAPKCGGCKGPITENYISALDKSWHPDCFKCRECNIPFGDANFFDYEGEPLCAIHYHAAKGSLCSSCQKPIKGRCITAMYRKFHPEHFVCSFCLKQLNKGTFKEQNDKPYCHICFGKLFA